MAKDNGLGSNFYIGGYDLSGDVGAVQAIKGSHALLEVTGIDKYAVERITGLRDGQMAWTNWFNFDDGQEHPVLSVLPYTDVTAMYFHKTVQGNPAAVILGKQADYDWDRAGDGAMKGTVTVNGNGYGLEWGIQQTAGKQTDSSASNSTGYDSGLVSGSAFGLQAYLMVFSIGSGTPAVKLQDSTDDGGGDAYADIVGGSFGTVTAPGVYRLATAPDLTVDEWVRIKTTGTFTNMVFAVVVVRNETTPIF